eukprot:scaffold66041_cov61-Phaeocystis_antarctica.AAC.2
MSTVKDEPRIVSSDDATRPSLAPDEPGLPPWHRADAARRTPWRCAATPAPPTRSCTHRWPPGLVGGVATGTVQGPPP